MSTASIVFLIFMALKLASFITWSWWLVCLPIYPVIVIRLWIICKETTAELKAEERRDKRRKG